LDSARVRSRDPARSGGSYCSASDPKVHFGLSNSDGTVSVTAHWVDGKVETWDNVWMDVQHTLVEGSGAEE